MITCKCPANAALTTIPAQSCVESFGQIQKVAFQRLQLTAGEKNYFHISAITQLSEWSAILSAADNGKIVISPYIQAPTVEAGADEVSVLTSLPTGTTIYYHSYATIASGETLYGNVQSFKTLSLTTGSGTVEDPYLIGNTADWNSLRTYINEGNDCAGLTFALKNVT